jgi:hypothetical protein
VTLKEWNMQSQLQEREKLTYQLNRLRKLRGCRLREKSLKQRKENEIRDIQAKHTRDRIAQLANTEIGKKVLEGMPAE